jgi:hypothetical protein
MTFEHTTCANCGKPIVVALTAHYCSGRCRTAAHRKCKRGDTPLHAHESPPVESPRDGPLHAAEPDDAPGNEGRWMNLDDPEDGTWVNLDDEAPLGHDGLAPTRTIGMWEVTNLCRALQRIRVALKARPDLNEDDYLIDFRDSILSHDDDPNFERPVSVGVRT